MIACTDKFGRFPHAGMFLPYLGAAELAKCLASA